ncbi:MAG: CpaF family protein [Anaerolineales bacterium]|nr:CpaF family protein [Anaerolineales bacterium]
MKDRLPPTLTSRHGDLHDSLHLQLSEQLEEEMASEGLREVPDRQALTRRTGALLSERAEILTADETEAVIRAVVDRIIGLGPLEPLLEDSSITEIMVNDPESVFIERNGRIERVDVRFRDEAHLRHVIDRIVAPIGRRIDESSPLVDARLPDGSRVNAVIPPLTIGGPTLTIRKFSREPFTLQRLVELGTVDEEMASYLNASVKDRVSMIVSGGTGSGKTSTLNALGDCIPEAERLITIEDAAELQLDHDDLVSMEARPPNIEGRGEITIRTLVRNALRMRPDRVIVGEVRGGEAFDMLQAMNTGHRGSMTTLHANSPPDALIRLESMVLMAGFDMPVTAIRRMIAGAVELIVQQDRLPDGRRVVTAVAALDRSSTDGLKLKPVFLYDFERGTHYRPEKGNSGIT